MLGARFREEIRRPHAPGNLWKVASPRRKQDRDPFLPGVMPGPLSTRIAKMTLRPDLLTPLGFGGRSEEGSGRNFPNRRVYRFVSTPKYRARRLSARPEKKRRLPAPTGPFGSSSSHPLRQTGTALRQRTESYSYSWQSSSYVWEFEKAAMAPTSLRP
jgi:hypothetical protein